MALKRSVVALFIAVGGSLSACAAHRVEGVVEGGREVFSGGSFREIDGGGVLTVQSSLGVVCTGDFAYVRPREGAGTFRCSDGRAGPFSFVSTGLRGTGQGVVGGRRFVFSFGLA
jgi:hypothetical protein